MSPYTLSFKNSVEKDYRKIPKDLLPNIFEHMENLSNNPLPHDAIKLAGAESLYRIRVGEYRIICREFVQIPVCDRYYRRHRSVAYRGM